MSTPEHTPGPWQVFVCDDGGQWSGWPLSISSVEDEDKSVVRPGGFYPYEWDNATSQAEAVANARLIAAAPELLDILDEFVCQYGCHCGHPACNDCGRTQEAERVMRKVKGEPS